VLALYAPANIVNLELQPSAAALAFLWWNSAGREAISTLESERALIAVPSALFVRAIERGKFKRALYH
jgi:hypothetical protein